MRFSLDVAERMHVISKVAEVHQGGIVLEKQCKHRLRLQCRRDQNG